ncbi:hypothetical protein Tco_0556913 [Tanacetum coccineum]
MLTPLSTSVLRAEAIATACFTQNRSLVILDKRKAPIISIMPGETDSQVLIITVGSLCYIIRVAENRDKNDGKSRNRTKEHQKEAMADSAWIESMQEELHQFDRLDVWELVDRPLCKNVINLKWLWKNKRDEENTIIRNKSLSCGAKDNAQKKEMISKSPFCTCCSVGGCTTVHCEEVYVNQPDGFVDPYHPDKVYRLKKAFMFSNSTKHVDSDPPIPSWYLYKPEQTKPTEKHLTAVKRIFRYLKDSINMGLWYPKDTGFELTAFSDSDHAGCLDSRKSTSGGIQFLGGDKLVSWSSKKQDCTQFLHRGKKKAAEYVSLSACCAQVLWMRTQLTDYGFHTI